MRLNSDNTIVASSDSNLKLTVAMSNYYLNSNDVAVFTLNGVAYPCVISDRVYIKVDFDITLPEGNYKYDLAVTRDGNKTLTIMDGDFIVKTSLKGYLLSLINKLYRTDAWLNNLFDSAGMALSEASAYVDIIWNNYYFDSCSETQLRTYEKEAKVILPGGQTIDERRSQLMAKWQGASKCTLETMQAVCNSWRDATISLQFVNGRIRVKFISPIGVPPDLNALQKALEDVKPAHLAIEYEFLYKTWGTAKQAGNWSVHYDSGNGIWNDLRQNEE